MRVACLGLCLLIGACTTRGPVAMSARELKARGTHAFNAPFADVFDATWLSLERQEGRVALASLQEGIIETEKAEFTAPPGWDGPAYRSYAASVYQEGGQVAVTAIPRLWAGERDVSEEPRWVLAGPDGEDSRWERLFDNVSTLLTRWADPPELSLDKALGQIRVLKTRFAVPPDWRGLELTVDRRTVFAQATARGAAGCADCPGGINPTLVFEVVRRHPTPLAPKLERVALEHALGPKLTTPEAWEMSDSPTGLRGSGQVVVGDGPGTRSVVWRLWDAGDPTWMIRVAAACAPAQTPGECDAVWEAVINGVTTDP